MDLDIDASRIARGPVARSSRFRPALMLARQWSLRRSSAAASVESGVPRVQECFRLHLNAVGSGVTIVQVRLVVVHYAGVSLSVICLPL